MKIEHVFFWRRYREIGLSLLLHEGNRHGLDFLISSMALVPVANEVIGIPLQGLGILVIKQIGEVAPEVIFAHYRELVTPDAAKAWFDIHPKV